MDQIEAERIFSYNNLGTARKLKKIDVGFTNKVYDANNTYILKVCEDESNEKYFKREAKLYEYFESKLPVPKVVVYDDSKSLTGKHYMIYGKIHGDNLYNVWHTLTDDQREGIISQLCNILKSINQTNPGSLPKDVEFDLPESWKSKVEDRLYKYLAVAETMKTFSKEEVKKIRKFIESKEHALEEEKIALVYWDAHFDNILVRDGKIVGFLDFERTELASIDYALDIVRRMIESPGKYMSEYAQQFAKDDDYRNLMSWYRRYYPELFSFDHLKTRLDLYDIAHNLEDLENWPQDKQLRSNILKIV